MSEATLLTFLRKMPPRLYSIASSLEAHPDEVHLTVAAVRYDFNGRPHQGVASTFLADRIAVGASVPVFIERNEYFKLPEDDSADIIMVGPGTGVAPFRAFVEARSETSRQHPASQQGKNWLFFGNPHFETDFLYQTEWLQHLKRGTLDRLDVAFSRDQTEKVYVQLLSDAWTDLDLSNVPASNGQEQLLAAYRKHFVAINAPGLTLSHFFARQRYDGGDYLHRRFRNGEPYRPWLITEAGSVFAFAITGAEQAKQTLAHWRQDGLPTRDPDDWQRNPYRRQNGYGEVAISHQPAVCVQLKSTSEGEK